jgi:RNA polymerase sigma factor (sigma-70 family)
LLPPKGTDPETLWFFSCKRAVFSGPPEGAMIAIVDPRQADAVVVDEGHAPVVAVLLASSKKKPLAGLDDGLFGDIVAGEGPLPEERVEDTLRSEALRGALALLDEREQTVIVLRFGLHGSEPKTLAEIGQRLGVSPERARQLEREALKRLARLDETESLAR